MKLDFINETNHDFLPETASFQHWLDAVSATLGLNDKSICITIVDEAESKALNHQYRQKDYPTNVLSFHYDPVPGFNHDSLGDLAICATIVKKEAEEQGKTISSHFAHMSIHGVLHLLGYDHINDSDAEKMEALEINILHQLGFPNPYEAH